MLLNKKWKQQQGRICLLTCVILCFSFCRVSFAEASNGLNIKGNTLSSYSGTGVSVTVPKKVRTIGKKAFAGNKKIQTVIIKQGVKIIRASAFSNCTKLKTVELPVSVKKISEDAFSGCKKLTIVAKKGSYALKFAKKKGISWKTKASSGTESSTETTSVYHITGITCYWYTAGVYPMVVQKKTIENPAQFDLIYEQVMMLNTGIKAEDTDQISGGKVLRVLFRFSDKNSRIIECNPAVYMEDGVSNKIAGDVSLESFWNSLEGEVSEESSLQD